jgi:glutamate-ammonia-ligase adenylyltransferase
MARATRIRALSRSIDAGRAEDYSARLAPRLGDGSEAHALGVLLCAAHPALAPAVEGDPDALRRIVEGYVSAHDRRAILARLAERTGVLLGRPLAPIEADRAARELRRGAREERMRIALRELLPASLGGADVDVTSAELAALADATVEIALAEAIFAVSSRLGAPLAADGAPARFVVLGMGKLGGGELNAGSDVDLIYLYDTDEGGAVAPDGTTSSLHEVWTRVARRVTATLDEPTEDGLVWRVDLRLRPEGRSGPLVNSIAAIERYYEAFGRLWERAALLRARPVAGDLALGEEALAALTPFVWRRRVDPSIAVDMMHLVRRARAELSPAAARDLKHGVGGIREAEFFAQSLQLIWGGREPRVRAKGTLHALRRLRATGYVGDREARDVTEAYLALRRAEHAVQVSSGVQTHLLPEAPAELERLSRMLGFSSADAFLADLNRHMRRVADRFASLLPDGPPPQSRWVEALAALDQADRAAFAEALARVGVAPRVPEGAGEADAARDLFELSRHPDKPLGARSRERFPWLAETALDAVADAADPEQAARYLRMLFGRLGHPGVYVSILGDRPQSVRRLVEAMGASAFIGDAVVNNPELGDEVLFSRDLPTPDRARDDVLAAIAEPHGDEDEDEALVGALRRAKARVTLRVGLAHLSSEIGTRVATAALSALADASLEAATRAAARAPAGEPVRGLSVVALGKLGGRDLGYGSDLDVIFLYDPEAAPAGADPGEHFSRAARRVIRLISMSHGAGPGYELDTRLRPSGSQGLLVTSLEAFARYHGCAVPGRASDAPASGADRPAVPQVRAAVWERLALLRARFVAGDPELGALAMRVAHETAYARPDDEARLAMEIHRLRKRMERELSSERPGRYDLKFGRGGSLDVEFTVQLLQMKHGDAPRARTPETLAAIDALDAAGHLLAEHREALRQGYTFLRELEERIRIVHADSARLLEETAPGLGPLARRMGLRDRRGAEAAAELLGLYRDVTDRVRAAYEAIVVEAARGAVEPPQPSRPGQ